MNLSSLIANLDGHQRKVVSWAVRPARAEHGTEGIVVRDGRTLPFVVERAWNAPAGHFPERWYIVDPETREVLNEGPERLARIWGLQSWTELSDEVARPIRLTPGTRLFVFALGGVLGGEYEFDVVEDRTAAPAAG